VQLALYEMYRPVATLSCRRSSNDCRGWIRVDFFGGVQTDSRDAGSVEANWQRSDPGKEP
jgi:hypothetical protein